ADVPSGGELGRAAGTAGLIADHLQTRSPVAALDLDVLQRHRARLGDAVDPRDDFAPVARNARSLRKRAERIRFDDPDVRLDGLQQRQRVRCLSAIYPGHGYDDREQQAEAEAGQQKPAELVPDIAPREVHFVFSSFETIFAARPALRPATGLSTTSAPSGTPPTISIRPSSVRWPTVTVRCCR